MSNRDLPITQDQALEIAFQMARNRIRLTIDFNSDLGEEPYQVTVIGVARSVWGFEDYDVEILGEHQAGTVGLMELMGYLAFGLIRIVGIS